MAITASTNDAPSAVSASILPSGRGFPAASMDPECLALLAYSRLLLVSLPPPTTVEDDAAHALPSWLTTEPASLDVTAPLLGPKDGKLPVVRCPCGLTKSGALSILGHFGSCDKMGGERSLDSWMDDSQQSDCYAWSSYAVSSLAMLIDLYLYVTPENYYSTTRPAYTAFLPWYANYIIPPAHRTAAKQRTAHLGVHDLLGVSKDDEEPDSASAKSREGGVDAAAGFPARFGLGRPSREALLLKAQRNMRLDALVSRTVGPLDELLGGKGYFISEERPCSLDAIALGYFKILLDTKVPDPWAAKLLVDKFPKLVDWCSKNDCFID